MADTQNVIYAQAYSANIMQLAQQQFSKLMGTVYQKPNVKGKTFFQDQIGAWAMQQKAGRNSQTPNSDPGLARRMGTMLDYNDNVLLDRGDEIRTISVPRSAYAIAAGGAIGRQFDSIIIAAASATALSGETGATSVTNSNIVLITAASVTLARVAAVQKALDDKNVPAEDRYFVANNTIKASLMNLATATSSDYASKALINGEILQWMGFKWIFSTLLDSTNIGIAYHKTGICLAGADGSPMVRTDERTDLSYSWQIYYEINAGAVRLEEDKVVLINEG
jgi:hypothetical protein